VAHIVIGSKKLALTARGLLTKLAKANALTSTALRDYKAALKVLTDDQSVKQVAGGFGGFIKGPPTAITAKFKEFLSTVASQGAKFFRTYGKVLALAGLGGSVAYALGAADAEDGDLALVPDLLEEAIEGEEEMDENEDTLQPGDIAAAQALLNRTDRVLRGLRVSPTTLKALISLLNEDQKRMDEVLTVLERNPR
jgi:hypothetical protein